MPTGDSSPLYTWHWNVFFSLIGLQSAAAWPHAFTSAIKMHLVSLHWRSTSQKPCPLWTAWPALSIIIAHWCYARFHGGHAVLRRQAELLWSCAIVWTTALLLKQGTDWCYFCYVRVECGHSGMWFGRICPQNISSGFASILWCGLLLSDSNLITENTF